MTVTVTEVDTKKSIILKDNDEVRFPTSVLTPGVIKIEDGAVFEVVRTGKTNRKRVVSWGVLGKNSLFRTMPDGSLVELYQEEIHASRKAKDLAASPQPVTPQTLTKEYYVEGSGVKSHDEAISFSRSCFKKTAHEFLDANPEYKTFTIDENGTYVDEWSPNVVTNDFILFAVEKVHGYNFKVKTSITFSK